MTDAVHVWFIRVDLPPSDLGGLWSVLDADERRRAARLALVRHRRRFVAVHGIARVITGHWLAVPAERITWRRGPHGKPELAGAPAPHVNLSHSGDLALLAVSGHRPCGVDVQRLPGPGRALRLARRFFPAGEAELVRDAATPAERFGVLWTRKEACLKGTGGRLVPGLRVPVTGSGPDAVRDLPVPDGYRAAVALAGDTPFAVRRHWWPPELDHEVPDMMAVQTCSTVR
jgi:4'-phosphopantetheinyl transferase